MSESKSPFSRHIMSKTALKRLSTERRHRVYRGHKPGQFISSGKAEGLSEPNASAQTGDSNPVEILRRIGERIAEARILNYPKESQESFGKRIGASKNTICRMETGAAGVAFETYIRAAIVLGVSDRLLSAFDVSDQIKELEAEQLLHHVLDAALSTPSVYNHPGKVSMSSLDRALPSIDKDTVLSLDRALPSIDKVTVQAPNSSSPSAYRPWEAGFLERANRIRKHADRYLSMNSSISSQSSESKSK